MSGHTPGPWDVQDGAIYAAETEPVHGGKTCAECGHPPTECGPAVIVPVEPSLIKDIKRGFWDDCDPPSAEDLRLIAAAPELLSALCALGVIGNSYCFCSEDRDPAKGDHQPECIDARLAIAKATGEQP